MNQTHIHLLITHLPIFASMLGGLVLAYSILTKSNQTKIAAYYIFIIAAIGAGIAYLTGEAAEDTVENIQGITKNLIEEHEDSAIFSLVSLIVLGVTSIGGLYLTFKNSSLTRKTAFVILFISFISFGLIARTGYLGGQIRHTEINSVNTTQHQNGDHDDDD
ncbi:MAG: hypothetical protein IT280_04135 [Ignavibacteria bacterium]|nr:hypothetical protein [Ignavibacteria bacterium]